MRATLTFTDDDGTVIAIAKTEVRSGGIDQEFKVPFLLGDKAFRGYRLTFEVVDLPRRPGQPL